MVDWTDISNDTLAEEKPIPQTVIRQMRDNSQYNKDRAESWGGFRVYASAVSGVSVTTWTEDFDPDGNFATPTYTVPETGVYFLGVQIKADITASGSMIKVQIKNGATVLAESYAYASAEGGGDDYLTAKCTTIEMLTADDEITITITNEAAGSPITFTGHEHTYFYGYKLPGTEEY